MLGETTFVTYIAYGALVLLLVVMVMMVVRVLVWLSLLLIAPSAEIIQKVPGLRRFLRTKAPETQTAPGNDPQGGV